jgi:glyceraldehyde-3-phosphate dehydrogenase (NADP+)
MRELPIHERARILDGISAGIAERREELADLIVAEVGKPISFALGEVDRAVQTFRLGAEEARRWGGEVMPVDIQPSTEGYRCLWTRFPRGPVAAISPFNFPLNLVAHKIAPAIAVGNAAVLKPPPQGPTAALRLAEIALGAGLPPEALSVLACPIPVAERLATDAAFQVLTFTGSARVGWYLKALAGKKRVMLELGGNAAMVVHEDADLDWAARRAALGSFAYSGQVCISVQRLFVHAPAYEPFLERFLEQIASLPVGDPTDPTTVVGPMIDEAAADRGKAWVQEAVDAGARVVSEGKRSGNVVHPTLLADVRPDLSVSCEEVFGPVAVVDRYESWEEALERVNETRYGLQAGIFTRDIGRIAAAYRGLQVGGVVVGDYPMLRVDNFPYGGIRDSGLGREGVRFAMEEMSDPRVLILRT